MDDEIDELFALPPAEFTAARNALVKRLRAEKRREEADAVKALRRPTVAAWAVNQVARSNAAAVERLIEAGGAVAAAQRRALSGVRDAGLREASAQRRERADELWKLAADVLRDAGVDPQPHRPTVSATLEAASLDPEAAELVRRGRLSQDLPAPSGFGEVFGFSVVDAENEPAEAGETAPADATKDGDAGKARARAEQQLAEAVQHVKRAERRVQELQERAADARRAAVRTAAEAERLERRAAQVRASADEENATADDLAAEAQRAEQTVAELQAEADALRDFLGTSS